MAMAQEKTKQLPPPSPVRSILAGSLAGGIEIGTSRVTRDPFIDGLIKLTLLSL